MSVEYKNLEKCKLYLKNGGVVAFPTETVYGLGANALDNSAVSDIFKIKERPTTDPVIIHIHNLDQIHELVDITESEFAIIKKIADKFWPGPLTLLLKASNQIPNIVTANSGYVGIRIPNNLLTLELLKITGLPIAAPSANKFEHISATELYHIENDFKNKHTLDRPLYILSDNKYDINMKEHKIGIESTIIKIDFIKKKFIILRPGFITSYDLKDILKEINYKLVSEELESSDQSIRHYATRCHTILISPSRKIILEDLPVKKNIAILDVGDICYHLKNDIVYYDNLSYSSNVYEMTSNFYRKLRDFEVYSTYNKITVLYLINNINNIINENNVEKYKSLYDRMYRSSSGNCLFI